MKTLPLQDAPVIVVEPRSGWKFVDFGELREYRDLFYFLVWRDVKALYAQTILGFAWAILNPLTQIVVFSVIFGNVAKVSTDGVPYALFSSVAIIPWTYISEAIVSSSQSLVSGSSMLGKIYFPRLIFPLTPVISKLIDFAISLIILVCVLAWYRVAPTWNILYAPFFLALMICIPSALGIWLSSLAIRYRDLKFAMPFVIRMLMYSAPVVYSASSIPEPYRMLYSLNPIVGVIEGFRASLLGTPLQWQYILPGAAVCLVLLVSGCYYFRRMEDVIVDVI